MGFGGCVLTTSLTLEMFSNVLLDFHSSSDAAYLNLARHLAALRKAINSLKTYDTEGDPIEFNSQASIDFHPYPPLALQPICPYPTSFVPLGSADNQRVRFTYEGRVEERTFFFQGKLCNDADADKLGRICIKFVQAYGSEVHKWCATEGFAPALIANEKLPGGWFMIIMDFLDHSWIPLAEMTERPQAGELANRVHSAVTRLHRNGMVHGDLRDTNLLVKQQGSEFEFMLVDFDWAGYEGTARYPRHINTASQLHRPKDVQDGELIAVRHDVAMLQNLFSGFAPFRK
jgi:serine/threonine protein kinase